MRLLLMLDEPSSRPLCHDYFESRGCDSDVAGDAVGAEALIRFRSYDMLIADLPRDAAAREAAFRLVTLARRRNPELAAVLLTGGQVDLPAGAGWMTVLTKPQRLEDILLAGAGVSREVWQG